MLTGGPHMASWICVTVLSAALLALAVAGARSFRRRAIG
jgi:MYXO-CTERM domain-containing protein